MNHLWVWLIILGVLMGFYTATSDAMHAESLKERFEAVKKVGAELTDACFKRSMLAVEICLEYIGLMALWLGLMKLAEESGIVAFLARLVRPIMHFLFPSIPKKKALPTACKVSNHTVFNCVIMNDIINEALLKDCAFCYIREL